MALTDRKKTSTTMLIDDAGSVTDSRSLNLRTNLRAVHIGDGFDDYAVRNLGFVALQPGTRSVHIRLRPSHVSPVAFAGLMYWLADQTPDRVMLSTFEDTDWRHQVIGNSDKAVAQIRQLVARAQRPRDDNFLIAPRAIADLSADHPMRRLYEARAELQDAVARLSLNDVSRLMADHVGGRHSISTADPKLNRIVLAAVGDGFDAEPSYWLRRVIGCRLDDLPDASYGAWAVETYAEVIRQGDPQLHDLDVMIGWPDDGSRKRYRSKRLLMPMKDGEGRHVVLSTTLADASIDLRRSLRDEPL